MKKKQLLEKSQELINSETLLVRHRASEKYFTRARKLCFSMLILLIIRKSVKSMQLILNELSIELDTKPVTAAAFTKARAKLKHTAYFKL
jgi:hypothetical protein